MKNIQDFFLFCSGVETSVLEKCPTDRNKYAGIGATIFFTGILAMFSSGYALFTVFDSLWPAVGLGVLWGIMIFNLDRYIVMSMKSRGKWGRDFLVAFPRLLMAVLLALVISKPLELKIFEKEIRAEMILMEQEVFKQQEDRVKLRYSLQIEDLRTQIAGIKEEIVLKTTWRDSLARAVVQEADGTGGSRHKNLGPIYRAKKMQADQAQAELDGFLALNQPIIRDKEQAVQQLETGIQQEISRLERGRFDGLAARMDALSRLTGRSTAILWASIFITLLFVAVETAPILVKLISPRSPYDFVLHQQEHVYEMTHLEQTTLLGNAVKNKLQVDTEVGIHRANAAVEKEKAIIDQKLQETLESLKNRTYKFG
ncbi:MAG: DUF4407 domain-containing protein [Saprospiraceae bacterium]|nr:DUF4407 domain-containing protein [Saprospiraceae bacterium]